MFRSALVLVVICLLALAAPALAQPPADDSFLEPSPILVAQQQKKPLRDCPTEHRECYADAGKGAYLGKAACPTCWKWDELACDFCWGKKEPVSRCNSAYSKCNGNCWSCDGGRDGCCLDKDGNEHGNCENASKLKKAGG